MIEFDPERQAWRWHATVAAYAARRWSPDDAERRDRLARLMDAWRAWLTAVEPDDAERRLTAERANLELLVTDARSVPAKTARAFLKTLAAALPAPDRTLALRAIQASLYRTLVDLAQDDGERAGALNNLGIALSALGQREEALAATQEAVDLCRALAEARPDAFRPALARSLHNLGAHLAALGRYDEALAATQEAVAIRRALAEARPDAVRPDLATSLTNLGIALAALGRYDEALAATQEAVAIRRALAEARPDAFCPDLARSLNVLGVCYAALDRHAEALDACEEAVRTLLPAFQRLPAAFADQMAYSVRAYKAACVRLGRAPDAALLAAAGQPPE